MSTILQELENAFRAAIQAALGFDADPALAVSQNEKFGDYQANAAMNLAKRMTESTGEKTNPRAVAEQHQSEIGTRQSCQRNQHRRAGVYQCAIGGR